MRTHCLTGAGAAVVVGLALVVLPAVPASARGLSQLQINAIEKHLRNVRNVTFEATFITVNGSQKQTVTIAQAPHKSYFGAAAGAVIDTGKTTYYCSTGSTTGGTGSTGNTGTATSDNSGSTSTSTTSTTTTTAEPGPLQCAKQPSVSPLLGIELLFSPVDALSLLNEAKQRTVATGLGVHLTSSTGTFAGQSATCFSGTVRGNSGKYCVTNKGILAYITTGSGTDNYVELTKYSSQPPPSLFGVPAGTTTATTTTTTTSVPVP